MSREYDLYLIKHKNDVKNGYKWLRENCPFLFDGYDDYNSKEKDDLEYRIEFHDYSKDYQDEYNAYDAYFYGKNRSFEVVENFNRAWLLHIHRNPHHWQHWVLINDDPTEGETVLEMPYSYVIEMICDWWSFSWEKGDLFEIFRWYDERKDYIKLGDTTRKVVEMILDKMKTKLEMSKEVAA